MSPISIRFKTFTGLSLRKLNSKTIVEYSCLKENFKENFKGFLTVYYGFNLQTWGFGLVGKCPTLDDKRCPASIIRIFLYASKRLN